MTPRDWYGRLVRFYALRYSLDWRRSLAQATQESALDPCAVNAKSGAMGLFQFMPDTWEDVSKRLGKEGDVAWSPFNPASATEANAFYMDWLRQEVSPSVMAPDLWRAVLAAYNWGIGDMIGWKDKEGQHHLGFLQRHDGRVDMTELPHQTRVYIDRIERIYSEIATGAGGSA